MKINKGWLTVLMTLIVAIVISPFMSFGADSSAPQAPAGPTNLRITDSPKQVQAPASTTPTPKDVHWFKATLGTLATMKGDDVERRKHALMAKYNKEALASSVMLAKEGLPSKLEAKMDLSKYKQFAKPPTGGAVNKLQKTAEAK